MINEKELAEECGKFNGHAQKELYRLYSPKMRSICIRYAKDADEAKDIMQDGFIKVYKNIHKFSASGSLEGWVRRIMINTAITYLDKNKKHRYSMQVSNEMEMADVIENTNDDELMSGSFSHELLLQALNSLPEDFRLVFNLYFIEEYSHKEIADLLNINENTSRSRLGRARTQLKNYLSNFKES